MCGERRNFAFDEIDHFGRIRRTFPGNVLTDLNQIVNGLPLPMNGMHAPLSRLFNGSAYLLHCLVVIDGWTGIVNCLLHLGFQPLGI